MKFQFEKSNEEKVVVYASERNKIVDQIEQLCSQDLFIPLKNIYGYLDKDIINIEISSISYIFIEDNKTIAKVGNKKYKIEGSIQELEKKLNTSFVQINRYALINVNYIERFDASWNGNLIVLLKDGTKDFVSRRRIKLLKERIGLK